MGTPNSSIVFPKQRGFQVELLGLIKSKSFNHLNNVWELSANSEPISKEPILFRVYWGIITSSHSNELDWPNTSRGRICDLPLHATAATDAVLPSLGLCLHGNVRWSVADFQSCLRHRDGRRRPGCWRRDRCWRHSRLLNHRASWLVPAVESGVHVCVNGLRLKWWRRWKRVLRLALFGSRRESSLAPWDPA